MPISIAWWPTSASCGRSRRRRDDLAKRLAGDGRAAGLIAAAKRAGEAAAALEARFHNPKAEIVYDILAQRGGTQLHSNLTFLYISAIWGEGAPSQGCERGRRGARVAARGSSKGSWRELKGGDLAELERQARELNLPRVLLKKSIEIGGARVADSAGRDRVRLS